MEIKRTKRIANETEEHHWHYDWATCKGMDKLKVYLSLMYASHLLLHSILYASPLVILLFVNIISTKTLMLMLSIYITSYFIYKPHQCNNNTLPWYPEWFKKHALWECAKFYSNWLTIRRGSDELYKDKQFIYGIQPHGILACNRILMMGHVWFDQIQPGTFGRFAAATPQFYFPGVRETSIWAAAVDASKRVLNTVISCGESIYLWVGGTKELLTTDPNSTDTKLVILDRYGFVKLAIVHGIDIVPVMQFGEKWVYRMYTFPPWLGSILYTFCKTPGIVFYGAFGFVPYAKRQDGIPIRMGMVIGEPIKVNKVEKEQIDFEKHIKPIHEEYMKRMRFLFETYKKDYDYGDDETLTFIRAKSV
eukprot:453645_1